jgi:hypothetical protein
MESTVQDLWARASEAPSHTWHWFMNLNREEWIVTLFAVCAFGFVCLLGFQSKRL